MSILASGKNTPVETREGTLATLITPGGRELSVAPMTFGKARLCVGVPGDPCYEDGWCYATPAQAILAAMEWDGEGDDPPYGWHRHIGSGRRRPDGDPEREYVQR
jgi:hypothetical protein